MFEHRKQPLIPYRHFLLRSLRFAAFSILIVAFSLFMGMVGYHWLAGITWTNAFYNASMILTGMGPGLDIDNMQELDPVQKDNIRIFAGFYALYSGVIFLVASSLILSPLLHRFFHKLHLDAEE